MTVSWESVFAFFAGLVGVITVIGYLAKIHAKMVLALDGWDKHGATHDKIDADIEELADRQTEHGKRLHAVEGRVSTLENTRR